MLVYVIERHGYPLILLHLFRSPPSTAPINFWALKKLTKHFPCGSHICEVHYGVVVFVFDTAIYCATAAVTRISSDHAALVFIHQTATKNVRHADHQPVPFGASFDKNAVRLHIPDTFDGRHIMRRHERPFSAVPVHYPFANVHRSLYIIAS